MSDLEDADSGFFDALDELDAPDLSALQHPLAQDLLLSPTAWTLWPAVAVLRWLIRANTGPEGALVYRSHPSLAFAAAEVMDVELRDDGVDLTLTAPGLAAPGSILPSVDIARIAADKRMPGGGALAAWLDGPGDRFMQAVEAGQMRYNTAFAFATGRGTVPSHRLAASIVGATAPLAADRDGRLMNAFDREPEGAIGLAAAFLGVPSAAGLTAAVEAYTGLPARVEEFTGAEVRVLRPARMGGPLTRILGRRCETPSAGVDVIVEGGERPEGAALARQRSRRLALGELCTSYIGSPSVQARLAVELDPPVVEPACLGQAEFGGLAVLGQPEERIRIPLRA